MALREVGTRHKVKELELLSLQQQSQAVQVTALRKDNDVRRVRKSIPVVL